MQKEGNLPLYLFHQGTNYRAYEYFGGHLVNVLFGVVEDRHEKVMHMPA